MRPGKLSNEELNKFIIGKIKHYNDEIITGASVGEDCCAFKSGNDTVVVSGDPITAAKSGAGRLAIFVTANDISAAGAYPVCAIITILLPVSAEINDLEILFDEITEAATELKIEIGGGHTEVTPAVNQAVINVTMFGKTFGDHMICSSGAVEGDYIVASKSAAIEGTLILADDYAENANVNLDEFDILQIDCMRDCLGVQKEGRIGALCNVHAMHDITEGGIIGAVSEICQSSGVGALTDLASVPVLPVTEKLCGVFSLNPYKFISSGSMLFVTDNPDILISRLAEEKIDAFIVGRIRETGLTDKTYGSGIFADVRDELYKLLGSMV